MTKKVAIEVENLSTGYDDTLIHEHLNLTVYEGEVLAIVGGSGCGKTTLFRALLHLLPPRAGRITVLGDLLSDNLLDAPRDLFRRWGVLFQTGALLSGLTVLENTSFPLKELTTLSPHLIEEIAYLKLSMSEFPLDSVHKYPSELSGGMLKRAALARAIVMDPELLFLDEPTSGLDPNAASKLDKLINHLQKSLKLTILVVSHDLDTLWQVADRVAFLGDKKVLAVEPMNTLIHHTHPLIKDYFTNARGKTHRQTKDDSHGISS